MKCLPLIHRSNRPFTTAPVKTPSMPSPALFKGVKKHLDNYHTEKHHKTPRFHEKERTWVGVGVMREIAIFKIDYVLEWNGLKYAKLSKTCPFPALRRC